MKRTIIIFLLTLLSVSAIATVHAQDMGPIVRPVYYLAADENGIQQVYQLLISDSTDSARQITRATSDVHTFGVSYDGLAAAYISGGQLWLQPIHTETPEALATISATNFFGSIVFSQDNQYIAYADNGVWLLDLGTRETTQLLADVPVQPDGSNAAEYRIHKPGTFVLGVDGSAAYLVVDIGVWEWKTAGVYNLATGTLQVLDGQTHTNVLPLYGDRALIYGNNAVSGDFTLRMAQSLSDINSSTEIVKFSDLTDVTLWAEQAVEIRPGTVRVFGSSLNLQLGSTGTFYFDYDLMAGTAGEVQFSDLPASTTGSTVSGRLSADGTLLPYYVDALWDELGSIYGALSLRDLTTGATVAAAFPATVGLFQWQP